MNLVFIWVNTIGTAGAFVSMVYYCLFIIVQLSRSINNRHGYKVRQLHDVKLLPSPKRLSSAGLPLTKLEPRKCSGQDYVLGCNIYRGKSKSCKRNVNEHAQFPQTVSRICPLTKPMMRLNQCICQDTDVFSCVTNVQVGIWQCIHTAHVLQPKHRQC
jgi:hypothetical protein